MNDLLLALLEPLTAMGERIAAGWPHRRLDELLPHRWKTLEQRGQ